MAYYIKDKNICELAVSDEGINIILKWLNSQKNEISIIKEGSYKRGESVTIQNMCWSSMDGINYKKDTVAKTNTLMMSKDEICINPVNDKDRNNITGELRDFIMELPSIIRDNKIKSILN